jgi:predicted nucleotidyltransferase
LVIGNRLAANIGHYKTENTKLTFVNSRRRPVSVNSITAMPCYGSRVKIQLDGLADIDPLRVPLPNGTEVVTRVEARDGERLIKQGAIGRVVSSDGDRVEVAIIGGARATYDREQLTPRKAGQLRFARRRHAAWEALGDTVILETVVGSRAWGLADESSDIDRRGVFALPMPWTCGLTDPPEDLVSADGSATYWEVAKTIGQAVRADPNTLEALFLESATAADPIGQWLLDERDAFASAEIYGSFGRYALSQLKKLRQSLRLAEHRGLLLEWLAADPSMDLDAAAARLASEVGASHDRARSYIKQLYSSMFDQQLLAERELASLAAFAAERAGDFELPRELRPKNAYNLLRLLVTATRWLREGIPTFEITGALRGELLAIKRGEVPLAEVLARAEELAEDLEDARAHTALPRRADIGRADALLRKIRVECARRYLERVPGPFGIDAIEPPAAAWSSENTRD